MEKELTCHKCGKPIVYDPYSDKHLHIYHEQCIPADTMLIQVNQWSTKRDYKVDFGRLRYRYNEVVIHCDTIYQGIQGVLMWAEPKYHFHCWYKGGQTSYPIDAEQIEAIRKDGIEAFMKWLDRRTKSGLIKCTACGRQMHETDVAGRPLFAGVNCADCWKKHQEHLELEKKKGHVCRMCGQPYGNCCC